jgi:ribose 5-phosphate isomerase A
VSIEDEKRAAAEAAATLVQDGMRVGLGTGSTVRYLLPALARRRLTLRCVATSPATESLAEELGLVVEPFETLDALDIAIDGADQVSRRRRRASSSSPRRTRWSMRSGRRCRSSC